MPREVRTHYQHFSWVVHEQRLVVLILGVLLAGCISVWVLAFHLGRKPPVVVRAGPSLKEAAAAFYGVPDVSYDALVFFLHGCLRFCIPSTIPGIRCFRSPRASWRRKFTARRSEGWAPRGRMCRPTA